MRARKVSRVLFAAGGRAPLRLAGALLAVAALAVSCGSAASSESSETSTPSSSQSTEAPASTDQAETSASSEPTQAEETATSDVAPPEQDEIELPASIRDAGKINIATVIPYQPHVMYADDGTTPEGLIVDLANAVAEKLGIEANIIPTSFDGIFAGVDSGRYDMALGGYEYTPERAEAMAVVAYQKAGVGLLVAQGNPKNIHTIRDLCGVKIAGLKGSTYGKLVAEFNEDECKANGLDPIQRDEYPDGASYFQALQAGRADAVLTADIAARWNADHSEGRMEFVEDFYYDLGLYGAFFSKPNGDLAHAFSAAVDSLIEDGTYEEIMTKWGGSPMEKTEVYGTD